MLLASEDIKQKQNEQTYHNGGTLHNREFPILQHWNKYTNNKTVEVT